MKIEFKDLLNFTLGILLAAIIFKPCSAEVIIGDNTKGGYARKLFLKDNYLYLADWYSGMHIYDVTFPYKPVHISNIHTPGSPKGIFVKEDRKSTRLNSSHGYISYAVFCLKKKNNT